MRCLWSVTIDAKRSTSSCSEVISGESLWNGVSIQHHSASRLGRHPENRSGEIKLSVHCDATWRMDLKYLPAQNLPRFRQVGLSNAHCFFSLETPEFG